MSAGRDLVPEICIIMGGFIKLGVHVHMQSSQSLPYSILGLITDNNKCLYALKLIKKLIRWAPHFPSRRSFIPITCRSWAAGSATFIR